MLFSLLIALSSFAAKMDKEFTCYSVMNRMSRTESFIIEDKLAIHPVDGYSFYAVSADGIQKCRVPSGASLAPDGKEGAGPWLIKLTHKKVPYHIQYPRPTEHLDLKGSPPWKKPECTTAPAGATAKVLENRIAESRQSCPDGPNLASCLSNFLALLSNCEGIPAIKDYVMEIGRSAKVHAAPASPNGGGGTPPQIGR